MQLSSILAPSAVFARLDVNSKKQALKELSAHAAEATGLVEKDIFRVLMERELHGSTGMGSGVSIPHGRFEEIDKAFAFFARLKQPVEFAAPDHKPVDLVFMLLTPASANNVHLKALALASKILRDKALCENLRQAPNAQVMHTLLLSQGGE